jgi:transposase, IS5 family
MRGAPGFFDVDDRLKRLSDLGDQLEAFQAAVDFEIFRADLNAALDYRSGLQGGRPPFDPVMMFKILVIQAANSLSDERAEFLINDRLSFMRFLGLNLSDRVPDARTIWLFREKLTKAGAIRGLFDRFDAALRTAGFIAMSGQIIDASLVATPKQRNTEDEKRAIKEGRVPEGWKATPGKLRQKDRDARWTVKFSKAKQRADGSKPPIDIAIPAFGYQNHVGIDRGFGLIRTWMVTDAAAYEGARLREGLLDKSNTAAVVWADSAYRSAGTRATWPATASSAASTARNRRASRCPTGPVGPMPRSPGSAPASSMSSPSKSLGWGSSSAPLGSPGPRPRSAWPISSTTSNA